MRLTCFDLGQHSFDVTMMKLSVVTAENKHEHDLDWGF